MAKRKSNKETHAQLFNRYIWLVDTIFRRGEITFEELSERWQRSTLNTSGDELPLRTFHNHKAAIQQMFDVNIDCNKRNGYKYYIENADDVERGGVRSWLINTFAVNNLINESHKLKSRILFEHIPSGQKYLTQIIEAMRDGITLEMTYHNFYSDKSNTFLIEPYCIKVFKQRWYVLAHSVYDDKMRIYSLDRIQNIYSTEQLFSLPEDFDGKEYFEDSFGIITDNKILKEEVSVKAFGNKAKYFNSLPLHQSQKIEEQTDDYTVFTYDIKPTYDFRQELLSHGADIQVLTPKWFVEEVKDIVKKQWKLYK